MGSTRHQPPDPGPPADRPGAAKDAHAAHFSRAFSAWRRQRLVWHLAAVAILAAVAVLRWWPEVTSAVRVDEQYYLKAIDWVLQGESPYRQPHYFYPPAFAVAGAAVVERFGAPAFLALLRSANLLALAGLVWCSCAWVAGTWSRRLIWAAGCLCLAPGAHLGVSSGNVSFLVIALILAGLLAWRPHPWLSGAALGTAAAIKPLSPVVIAALFAHRDGRQPRLAATVGLVLSAVLLLGFPHFGEMLELASGESRNLRTVSLHRLLWVLGFEIGAGWVAAAVAALTVFAVRRRPLGATHFLCLASAAVTLATPMMWNHTLLVALPIQVLALALAVRRSVGSRRRPTAVTGRQRRRYELMLVILGVAAIQLCDGVGGVETLAPWVQAAALAPPSLAPAALAAYILRTTDPF